MISWEADVLPGYRQHTLELGQDPDGEGNIVATLVRRDDPAGQPVVGAVLAVHGFTDYFFHTELADHFAAKGFRFYAIDLPKCGRSWRPDQTPHFTTELARYDRELQQATGIIRAESGTVPVLVYGHSAGGLIVPLWLDRVRRRGATAALGLAGLILNSPWLDLQGPALLRTAGTAAIGAISRVRKKGVLRPAGKGGYGTSLHHDYGGEFTYNLEWKPLGGFPVTSGWINTIRRGHARLHRGLDVGVPNLILRSDRSVAESNDPGAIACGDAVLDVTQIARWSGCIGNRTTVVPVTDAKHDVFLSLAGPRQAAYHELDSWLDWISTTLGLVGTSAQSRKG